MSKPQAGRFIVLALLVSLFLIPGLSSNSMCMAAKVFIDPETTYVTGGPGSVFSFDVEVDAATTNLFGYHIMVKYNKTLLDSVVVTEGPLLSSGGGSTIFIGGVDSDSSHVEGTSAILGGGGVNGPGVLFTVTARVSGSGIYNIDLDTVVLRDTSHSPLPANSANGIAYLNIPPSIFNLSIPTDGAVLYNCLSESLLFDWQTSTSPYPDTVVQNTLEYGTSPTFIPAQTTEVDSLIPSQHKILASFFTHNS